VYKNIFAQLFSIAHLARKLGLNSYVENNTTNSKVELLTKSEEKSKYEVSCCRVAQLNCSFAASPLEHFL
jgi:hypothetical protein